MWKLLGDVWRRRELLLLLVGRNLKIRYKNSVLGFFWSLLAPLLMILIYALFLRVLRFPIDLPVLVTGIIVWQFHATCLGDAPHALVGNANLVTKAPFPKVILPAAMVLANLVNFLLSGLVLGLYLVVVRADFGLLHVLPALILVQVALSAGLALLASTGNVFFRDTEHITSVAMLAWFFMTPVIYPIGLVTGPEGLPAWTHPLFFLNPMTGLVTAYRMVLLSAPGPGWSYLALSMVSIAFILALGTRVFLACEPRFSDEL